MAYCDCVRVSAAKGFTAQVIRASVIIPAHNEASVISRTLAPLVRRDDLEIIVVANGCTDDTAKVAATFGPFVRIIETPVGSKVNALNLGDDAAGQFPRIYLDADIELPSPTIDALIDVLNAGRFLAAAPRFQMDLTGCSWAVRAFYDINGRLPSAREGIGGSGVYALSEAGRARFGRFPDITADDGYVRVQFRPDERITLSDHLSIVRAPKTVRELIRIKTRSHFGTMELRQLYPSLFANVGERNSSEIKSMAINPLNWPNLAVYLYVKSLAKLRARRRLARGARPAWERDESSRAPVAHTSA